MAKLAKIAVVLVAVLATIISVGGSLFAAAQEASPVASPVTAGTGLPAAVTWLQSQQAEDGGFIGFSGASDPGVTVDAIIALVSANHAGIDTGDSIDRALAYLESGDVALVYAQTGVGQAAKLVLGLHAAGIAEAGIASVDPIQIVLHGQNAETGLYGTGVFDHALSMMALTVTGEDIPQTAFDALATTQSENGGWAFDGATDPAAVDSNTTSLVIQALIAAGHGDDDLVANGLAYLETVLVDGGAGYSAAPDPQPDANSTALVIQARLAAALDVSAQVEDLAAFQNESGGFFYNQADTTDNLFATVQAIPALASLALPVAPVESVATPVALRDALAA